MLYQGKRYKLDLVAHARARSACGCVCVCLCVCVCFFFCVCVLCVCVCLCTQRTLTAARMTRPFHLGMRDLFTEDLLAEFEAKATFFLCPALSTGTAW